MNAVASKIANRVRIKRRGWVFTPKSFLDLGTRATVDQTLSRLARQGMIRRLGRGLYDYPKQNKLLGTLSPSADSLARAISSKSGDIAFPSGATAANILGLSTQVPAKPVYMTNGQSRVQTVGNQTITFKHARVPLMDDLSDNANLVLQALSYLGKDSIDERTILQCANRLDDRDMKGLNTAIPHIPGWVADVIRRMQQIKYGQVRKQA
jgi:hypothetical protein